MQNESHNNNHWNFDFISNRIFSYRRPIRPSNHSNNTENWSDQLYLSSYDFSSSDFFVRKRGKKSNKNMKNSGKWRNKKW